MNGFAQAAALAGSGAPSSSVEEQPAAAVLTGASGMAMISEMFQRQARRLETQQELQAQDRKAVEYTQAQLLVMQAQLQWHASRYQERAEQVTKSSDTINRMQSYLGTMESERDRAVMTVQTLMRDVDAVRQHIETNHPQKLETLCTNLSDITMRVHTPTPPGTTAPPPPSLPRSPGVVARTLPQGTDLASLEGIGQLFAASQGAVAAGSAGARMPTSGKGEALTNSRQVSRAAFSTVSQSASHSSTGSTGSNSHSSLPSRHSARGHYHADAKGVSPPLEHAGRSGSGGSQQQSNGSGSDGANECEGSSSNPEGHSGSDSADAASAASTWPHAAATRRSRHLKDVKQDVGQAGDGPGGAPRQLARKGSPPENETHSASGDSSSNSNGSGSNGSRTQLDSSGHKSDDQNGEGSPPLDPTGDAPSVGQPAAAAAHVSATSHIGRGCIAAAAADVLHGHMPSAHAMPLAHGVHPSLAPGMTPGINSGMMPPLAAPNGIATNTASFNGALAQGLAQGELRQGLLEAPPVPVCPWGMSHHVGHSMPGVGLSPHVLPRAAAAHAPPGGLPAQGLMTSLTPGLAPQALGLSGLPACPFGPNLAGPFCTSAFPPAANLGVAAPMGATAHLTGLTHLPQLPALPQLPTLPASLASGIRGPPSAAVVQGVIPFPGQGIAELQQGVLVGGAFQDFSAPGASACAPTAAMLPAAMHLPPPPHGMAIEQGVVSEHELAASAAGHQPHVTNWQNARGASAPQITPHPHPACAEMQPPPKRAAASAVDAMGACSTASDAIAAGSRLRAEFGMVPPPREATSCNVETPEA